VGVIDEAGLGLALVLMAGIREKKELATIAEALKGAAMSFLIAGIPSMAFMGFAGLFSTA
jgi:electron transport complex protein RnfA